MSAWISLSFLILSGLLLLLRHDTTHIIGFDPLIAATVIAVVALMAFINQDADGERQPMAFERLRAPVVVLFLGTVVAGAYLWRTQLTNLATRIIGVETATVRTVRPTATPPQSLVALRLRRSSDGTFRARIKINGTALKLLVDTGATTIVLRAEDARRIGVAVDTLDFSVPIDTAAGTAYAAPIRLARVYVGPLGAANIDALVVRPGQLSTSLLGMSFLSRLRSYEVSGPFLTLKG